MDNFLMWNDWWSQKHREGLTLGQRYFSFKTALNLLYQRGGVNIVETGTIRMKDDWGAGMSTVVLADFAKAYGKKVWTCDIYEPSINLCKEITTEFKDNITYVVSDSILFLHTFPEKIDLLYLDSMDCPEFDEPDSPRLLASQNHQLEELKTAWDKLHDKSIVLLDDNNFTNGGKCKLSIEFLKEKGWECLVSDKHSLWIK